MNGGVCVCVCVCVCVMMQFSLGKIVLNSLWILKLRDVFLLGIFFWDPGEHPNMFPKTM